jgi:hypothetical protein
MADTSFDSRPETEQHIKQVQRLLMEILAKLAQRARTHDSSKLMSPEKECFDLYTPILKESNFGSEEYKQTLENMGQALQHHYQANRHHPEHFENGIDGMNLIDLIEMIADWKAATLRHTNGDIMKSIEINKKRFGISDQLAEILLNTARDLGWLI